MTQFAQTSPARRDSLVAASGTNHFASRKYFLFFMAAPAVIYVLLVGVAPLAQGAWYSLFDYNLLRPNRTAWVGLDNYARVFTDKSAVAAIYNTFVFTIVGVTIQLIAGFGLALLLWRDDRFNRMALAFLLIPVTITPLVVGLIYKALLGADYGFIGYWLQTWGIGAKGGLLTDASTALWVLIAIDCWEWTPLMALILLAGLKSLPLDVLEAARADGATPRQRLVWVVLPLMLPSVFLALILRMMDAFRIFDVPYVTTGGGPGDSTQTLMLLAAKEGLSFFNIGYASALGNVTLLFIAIMASVLLLAVRGADRRINGR